jgi:hypothetical protein
MLSSQARSTMLRSTFHLSANAQNLNPLNSFFASSTSSVISPSSSSSVSSIRLQTFALNSSLISRNFHSIPNCCFCGFKYRSLSYRLHSQTNSISHRNENAEQRINSKSSLLSNSTIKSFSTTSSGNALARMYTKLFEKSTETKTNENQTKQTEISNLNNNNRINNNNHNLNHNHNYQQQVNHNYCIPMIHQ